MIVKPETDLLSNGLLSPAWSRFFQSVFYACFALYESGTTANRPTKGLWIGRPYFDTTLGYQIHYNGSVWVDSAGSTV